LSRLKQFNQLNATGRSPYEREEGGTYWLVFVWLIELIELIVMEGSYRGVVELK
jgi:hypothetical protein